MEHIAQTVRGMEDIAIQEIKDLISVKAEKVAKARLLLKTKDADRLIYQTRSLDRVYRILSRFSFTNLKDITRNAGKIAYKIEQPFMVKCARSGKHEFNSQDVARAVGEVIHDKGHDVDLDEPKTVILVDIIDNGCFIGIDITKKELHKRDYRVKAVKESVNPCVAYAMLKIAGWKKNEVLLDPLCKDGVIPIEAALMASNIPLGFFLRDESFGEIDKKVSKEPLSIYAHDPLLHNVRASEINAKLADVHKLINFSKCDLDWIDTKFDKGSVDKIITGLIAGEDKQVSKLLKEIFYQANYVLKKGGKLLLASQNKELVGEHMKGFKLSKELKITIGGLSYLVLMFEKN